MKFTALLRLELLLESKRMETKLGSCLRATESRIEGEFLYRSCTQQKIICLLELMCLYLRSTQDKTLMGMPFGSTMMSKSAKN